MATLVLEDLPRDFLAPPLRAPEPTLRLIQILQAHPSAANQPLEVCRAPNYGHGIGTARDNAPEYRDR